MGDGQSEADPAAAGVAEALEGPEQAVAVGGRDPRAVVDYPQLDVVAAVSGGAPGPGDLAETR